MLHWLEKRNDDETWTVILTIHQFYVQASININIITQNVSLMRSAYFRFERKQSF